MFCRKLSTTSPDSFSFPFQPYPTQDQFMRALYEVIENGKIGLFESPTGTGKTLSIMCGALKWQHDDRTLSRADLNDQIKHLEMVIERCEKENAQSDSWLTGQYDTIQKKDQLNGLRQKLQAWDEYERLIEEARKSWQSNVMRKARYGFVQSAENAGDHNSTASIDSVINEDDDLVLEDKDSDADDEDEDGGSNINDGLTANNHRDLKVDSTHLYLLCQNTINPANFCSFQIFFCSRTHSQLSQAINELKKTVYQNSVRVVQLASRQQLCIFPEVQSLKSNALINERCLELKKGKRKPATIQAQKTAQDKNGRATKKARTLKVSCSCPYYNQTTIQNVANSVLYNAKGVMDIEQLVEAGRKEKGCPYYAARIAAKTAQVKTIGFIDSLVYGKQSLNKLSSFCLFVGDNATVPNDTA